MIKFIVFIALSMIYAGGISASEEKQSILEKNVITTRYTITEDTHKRDIKRRVVVLLYAKPSKEELKAIALKIYKDDSGSYTRTFISYNLNGASKYAGGWATTNFNPSLEIKILGLSNESEDSLLIKKNPDRKILGAFIDEILNCKRTFFIKNDEMFMEVHYDDGSNSIEGMKYEKINDYLRIEEKEGNDYGEYFRLTKQELQLWDTKGKLYTAKRIY